MKKNFFGVNYPVPRTQGVLGFHVCLAWRTRWTSSVGLEVKHPALPDGRATPTRQGHSQRWGVWRKHEAEPMYVANSEPATWRWGEGRAVVDERGLISGTIEPTWSRTGYGEVVRLIPLKGVLKRAQGSPTALAPRSVIGAIKPSRIGNPEALRGRGWQIHG